MKALPLLALGLALGVGVFFYLLDRGVPGRGGGNAAQVEPEPSPPARVERAPAIEPPAERAPVERLSLDADAGPSAAGRRTLEGAVIAEGAPVPGAHVGITCGTEILAETRCDERGAFRLEYDPSAGSLTLRVRARGFVPLERPLARPRGGAPAPVDVRLVRGTELRGRVVDGRGTGIADATIAAEARSGGADIVRTRARSGPDGRFELADSPPGQILVRASARGFGDRSVEAVAGPGSEELVIALEAGASLRLRVQDSEGPIEGAEVAIQSTDPRAPPRTARSDAQGRVAFERLGATIWNVRVTNSDHRPAGLGQVQVNGPEITIDCTRWPAITGIVRAPDGSPPPEGTRVVALPASAPGDRISPERSGKPVGSDGSFRIGGLRPGDWVVRAFAPGFPPVSSGSVRLGIESDGWAGTLTLEKGARLVLALSLEGQPLGGAEVELCLAAPKAVRLWEMQSQRGGRRLASQNDGTVEFSDLAPGEVWAAVFAPGCPPTLGGPYRVSQPGGNEPIALRLVRGARVHGQVARSGGAPLPGATVQLTAREHGLALPLDRLALLADKDGRYASAWLPAGTYSIEALGPGDPDLRSEPREVQLQSGEDREENLEL